MIQIAIAFPVHFLPLISFEKKSLNLRQNQSNMNPILKNILAVVAGILLGGAVNMGIIMISGLVK